jgi:type IV pilus assembly protein PilY1
VTVCWQGSTTCSTGNTEFGWYANLIGGVTTPAGLQEQVIFSPVFFQGAIFVDTIVPAQNIPTSCSSNLDAGYTYTLNVTNGGVFNNVYSLYAPTTGNFANTLANDTKAAAIETNASGSVVPLSTSQGIINIVFQEQGGGTLGSGNGGSFGTLQPNLPANTKSKRLTWVEKR